MSPGRNSSHQSEERGEERADSEDVDLVKDEVLYGLLDNDVDFKTNFTKDNGWKEQKKMIMPLSV